ncbi:endonuclease/exonuclease/phosphatase family protein [Salipiger sp. CCB-MM3]|uniref:endonuclease/exonuclease/phosphatase family protein n=1 Tax=Salipiger sp. CCB-MM3 TaxID=1792508 RepID=UPI0012F7E5E0|nr:endonuclease/exonuclease/phosphatase family protein [Salipiger sp. CCB-MM3]
MGLGKGGAMVKLGIEIALALAIPVSLAAPFLGNLWVTALLSNFVPQLFLLALVITLIGWASDLSTIRWLALSLALINGAVLASDIVLPRLAKPVANLPDDAPRLRVMTLNMLFSSRDDAALAEKIDAEKPDILLLQEITPARARQMSEIASRFSDYAPLGKVSRIGDRHGTVLFANHPILQHRELTLGGVSGRANAAQVQVGPETLWVVSFHTIKPTTPSGAKVQTRQLEDLAQWVKGIEGPVVVGGDFNATIHMPSLRHFLRETGMTSDMWADVPASAFIGTFPTLLPVFGVKIDHLMLREAQFDRVETVAVPDRDHLGLMADMWLEPK